MPLGHLGDGKKVFVRVSVGFICTIASVMLFRRMKCLHECPLLDGVMSVVYFCGLFLRNIEAWEKISNTRKMYGLTGITL